MRSNWPASPLGARPLQQAPARWVLAPPSARGRNGLPEGKRARVPCSWPAGLRLAVQLQAVPWPTLSLGRDAGDSRGGASITSAPKPPKLAPPQSRSPARLGMAAAGQGARMG